MQLSGRKRGSCKPRRQLGCTLSYQNPLPCTPFSLPHRHTGQNPRGREDRLQISPPKQTWGLFSIHLRRKWRSFLCYKKLSQLSLEQKVSAEHSSTRGTCLHSCRQLKGRLLMENIQQLGQQADSVTNCSLKLPSESSDREQSAFAGPKRGRRWPSYEAMVWLETMHSGQGLGRGDSAPT